MVASGRVSLNGEERRKTNFVDLLNYKGVFVCLFANPFALKALLFFFFFVLSFLFFSSPTGNYE